MASAIHAPATQLPPPQLSRAASNYSLPLGHLQLSPQSNNPFQTISSNARTPSETPPPSRHMSFSNYPNGGHAPSNGSRSYMDSSEYLIPQNSYAHKPSIYTAVYSGVSVYELEVNHIAVMRRRTDSWLNATQILKVAGVDKGKRTKILDKEILIGEHEKVQGGYGKYQGTWIPYNRGRDFCRQYHVEDVLSPLLDYDMGQDGVTQAGQGGNDTPTKEQAMAAQRKRNMMSVVQDHRPSASSPAKTFFSGISASAVNAVTAMNRARFDSPGPRPGSGNKRLPSSRKPSMQMNGSQESAYVGSSQQSLQSLHSEGSFGINGQLEPAFGSQSTPYFTNNGPIDPNLESQEPPRKRAKGSSHNSIRGQSFHGDHDVSMRETTPTEATDSFVYHQRDLEIQGLGNTTAGVQPLPQPRTKLDTERQELIRDLFLDPTRADFSDHPALNTFSGEDLDVPIDGTAHTALHWAATLAKPTLVKALIAKGASIYRVNAGGETALIRAARTTNNLDHQSFPELLDLLGPTIETRDGRGRTVLHHIAVSSAIKDRNPACRYYFDSLLEYVIHNGSAANSQQDLNDSLNPKSKPIALNRFMAEIVNAQDMSGDTALNLAARIGNKGVIQQLLEVGANPTIPNRGGLKPIDFGVGGDPEPQDLSKSTQTIVSPTREESNLNRVGKHSRDITANLSSLLSRTESSFRTELLAKQSLIDATHAELRQATTALAAERRRLADLHARSKARKALKSQIANLRRANEESRQVILRARREKEGNTASIVIDTNVVLGDADTGLTVDVSMLPTSPSAVLAGPQTAQTPTPASSQVQQLPGQQQQQQQQAHANGQASGLSHAPLNTAAAAAAAVTTTIVTPEMQRYIDALNLPFILEARLGVYDANNCRLRETVAALRAKSSGLEDKLRRVVALCTGKSDAEVDGLLEGLLAAHESERGKEIAGGRIRDFLRRVGEGGGGSP